MLLTSDHSPSSPPRRWPALWWTPCLGPSWAGSCWGSGRCQAAREESSRYLGHQRVGGEWSHLHNLTVTKKQRHCGESLPLGVPVNGVADATKPASRFAGLYSKIKTLFSYSAILKIELLKVTILQPTLSVCQRDCPPCPLWMCLTRPHDNPACINFVRSTDN